MFVDLLFLFHILLDQLYFVEELYCDPEKRWSSGDTFTFFFFLSVFFYFILFFIQKMKQHSGTVNTEN